MSLDLEGARKAGYSDAEIAGYLAQQHGFDLPAAQKAGYKDNEVIDYLSASPSVSDYAKSLASGALSGAGMIAEGGGELLARGLNAAGEAVGLNPELRAENPFQGAINWLEKSKTLGAHRAEAESQISGNLFEPSTYNFGTNPTVSGLALQGLNAIGQFAPNLAIAITTAGASVPAQLAIGATVGGLQALGGGAEQERQVFEAMTPDQLKASSTLYNNLIAKGVKPDVAKNAVKEAAALGGGIGNAIPSAAEGAFENFLIGALTRGKLKIPAAFGTGLAGKVTTGVLGGGALGGTEEAGEQIAQNVGSNIAVGGNRPVTADTLQQFVMGAIAEGAAGAGGAFTQHVFKTEEQATNQVIQKVTSAPSVDAAIAAASQAAAEPVYESDIAQSAVAESTGISEKVLKEEPAYIQRENQKQQEIINARDGRVKSLDEQIAALNSEDQARVAQARAERDAEIARLIKEAQTGGLAEQAAAAPQVGTVGLALQRALGVKEGELAQPANARVFGKPISEMTDQELQDAVQNHPMSAPRLVAQMEIKRRREAANASTVRGNQEIAPQVGQVEGGGGTNRGGNLQQAPATGINPNGAELRGPQGPARIENQAQLQFLDQKARAAGFQNVDQFSQRAPEAFNQAAVEWRTQQEGRQAQAAAEPPAIAAPPISRVEAPRAIQAPAATPVPPQAVASATAQPAAKAAPILIFGRPVEKLTIPELKIAAQKTPNPAKREAAQAELARRNIPIQGIEQPKVGVPATRQQLFVQYGNQRIEVASLEEAARKWDQFRQAAFNKGAGSGTVGSAKIIDQTGTEVARISQNGKVWPAGEWNPGMKPLIGENFKPSSQPIAQSATNVPATATVQPAAGKLNQVEQKAPEVNQREPWQMTREEYVADRRAALAREAGSNNPSLLSASRGTRFGQAAEIAHRTNVEKALAEGKPVPANVLASYPDLASRQLATTAPASSEAAPALTQEERQKLRQQRIERERAQAEEQKRQEQADREEMNRVTEEQAKELENAGRVTAPEHPAQTSKPLTGGKIADFGEKIGGARKDVWQTFKDRMSAAQDLDIVAEPLSKSWPEPDYQALLDAGADPWAVGFMHAARDEVPSKPRQSWKVQRWAEQVKLLRDVTLGLANGTYSTDRARALLAEASNLSRGMLDVASRAELYHLVGHSKSLSGVRVASGQYSVFEGKNFDPPKVIWTVEKRASATAFSNWPRILATGNTRVEAMQNFKDKFASLEITKPANKEVEFDIFSKRNENGYWIGKKIGRNPLLLEGPFQSIKDARTYKTEHQAELLAKLEKAKEIPNERRETNEPRVGEDMRNGQDVTPQMFAETFGFRGVEFGNWVEQGKRQQDLNDAFDALMDMAAILNVTPKAISLNGELGLAFGARGTGGIHPAKAHYESGHIVINLTKNEGAGSIGHEWWHALDNYFSRMREKKVDYLTEGLDVSLAARGSQYEHKGQVRKEMVDAFGQVVRGIRETAMKARASRLDAKRSKDYWTTGREMAARAFESYLISKLQDQNASNDYLANIVDEATWKAAESLGFELENSYPYPTAGEVPKIRAAFDHFFSAIQSKETEKGIALYQNEREYNPTEAENVYQAAQTRPGTTPEQRQLGIAALKGLFTRDRRAGISLLGSALQKDFIERKGADLIGQRAGSAEDLGLLAQVLRDPRFETLRFFFTRGDEIVGHTAVTSRLPGTVAFVKRISGMTDEEAWQSRIDELKSMMDNLEADGYYMLHNHPSGSSDPSLADMITTRRTAKTLEGFKGHVVIDNGEYSLIGPKGDSKKNFAPISKQAPELAHDALGHEITGPVALFKLAKYLQAKEGYATMISVSAQGQVQALAEVPEKLLTGTSKLGELRAIVRARKFAKGTGSTGVFIISDHPEAHDFLIKNGVVTDVIGTSGAHTSRQAAGVFRQTESKYKAGVLAAEQMEWNNQEAALEQEGAAYNVAHEAIASDRPFQSAANLWSDLTRSDRVLNRVVSKFNTPYHIAETHPEFKPVFNEAGAFDHDLSKAVNEAADEAKDILPRIESFRDFGKQTASKEDIDRVVDATMAGTLFGGGNPLQGRLWTEEELKTGRQIDKPGLSKPLPFGSLTERQIKLYQQNLAAVAHSLRDNATARIWRLAQSQKNEFGRRILSVNRGLGLDDAAQDVQDQVKERLAQLKLRLDAITEDTQRKRAKAEIDNLTAFASTVEDIARKTNGLIEHGYSPIQRFGKYAVYVEGKNKDGSRDQIDFRRFDTQFEANRVKRELSIEYKDRADVKVTSGVMADEAYKLFQGLNLDALEVFADHMTDDEGNPISADPIMQEYFRIAASERSILKRQIHRKGIAGYSRDLPRALAQFLVATATDTSRNYHSGAMLEHANEIKAGDLKNYATRYVKYLQDPAEEAHGLRSVLANYYILGSVAFGAVNMTQPILVTAPYLSSFTSYSNAVKELARAAKELVTGKKGLSEAERKAFERASSEGIVSPQEIHQIRADTRASAIGDSPLWNKLESIAASRGVKLPGKLWLRKASFLWGSIYGLTEQWNRGSTFIAAYRIAEAHKEVGDPYKFATEAVNATQFVYGRHNRMEASRGPIGSVVMTFKSFNVSYLELAKRLYTNDKKAFAILMFTLFALAGMEGLPFAEDVEDLIDTIGQWLGYGTNSKKKLRQLATELAGKDISSALLHGISAIPGAPIDVGQRMGMHNIIPGTAVLKTSEPDKARDIIELLGPAATLFKNVGSTVEGLATGKPESAKVLLPTALQNALKAEEMARTGEYRDRKGRKVMNVDLVDAMFKGVGFQPAKVAAESRVVGQNQQDIAMQKVIESSIADQWARGIVDNDPQAIKDAIQKIRDWNEANPELRVSIQGSQIRRRVQDMKRSREERFLKSAPKEIRGGVRQDMMQ